MDLGDKSCVIGILAILIAYVVGNASFMCDRREIRDFSKDSYGVGKRRDCAYFSSIYNETFFQNKCAVYIEEVDGKIHEIDTQCLDRDTDPNKVCDKTTTKQQKGDDGNVRIRWCCCDSQMCNNEAFIDQCKAAFNGATRYIGGGNFVLAVVSFNMLVLLNQIY